MRKFLIIIIRKFWIIAIAIFVCYIFYALISTYASRSRLDSIEGKSVYTISNILDVSENRITQHVTTYNKGAFIEYNCIVDSIYYINIVKIGKLQNGNLLNCISFSEKSFSSRFGWISHPMATPSPFFIISPNYISFYNVYLLPFNQIDKIYLHAEGKILSQDTATDNVLSFSVQIKSISFAFENYNKEDLILVCTNVTEIPVSKLVFFKDEDNILYIINISTKNKAKPIIENIIKL